MADETLFAIQPITVKIAEENMPGFRGPRVYCEQCGEGINLRREVSREGRTLCVPCAQGSFLAGDSAVNPLNSTPKVVLIVGYKKVGKTTLVENLIVELSNRGYRVGSVKHHHSDYPAEIDSAGTDTWRHRRAGATTVALVTPRNVAVFRETEEATPLERVLSTFADQDIVLVEGFHLQPGAKIEVRSARGERLCRADNHLLAVVGPTAPDEAVLGFAPDQIEPLVDLIEKKILGKISTPASNHSPALNHAQRKKLWSAGTSQ
jgi:molybdopterin-guanine dinucleotide biosynthesis protein B